MAKSKAKKSKSSSRKTKPKDSKSKSVKKAKTAKRTKKAVKRNVARPQKSISAAHKAVQEDILEKYKRETGYDFDTPKSITEFDKHLEETAKLVSKEGKLSDDGLPHFSDHHLREAEIKEGTKFSEESNSMVDQLKKPETPDPDHHTLKAEHSHPYTDNPFSSHDYDNHHNTKKEIWTIVLSLVGVLCFVVSIVALVMSIQLVKKGSHTGKGTILISIASLIVNLALIFFFLNMSYGVF